MAHVEVERDGPVTMLRLDRPDHGGVRELYAAFGALHADPSQQVVVLAGAGWAFWPGLDRAEQAAGLAGALRRIPQPVIAVLSGAAVGTGPPLARAADLLVAETSAAAGESCVVCAAEAERTGPVDLLVPAGEGLKTAFVLAHEIALSAPVSARMIKSLLALSPGDAPRDEITGWETMISGGTRAARV